MRDIKFRAWDRFAKEMVFAKTIDFGINGAECIVDSSGIIGEVSSEWDLEQLTGLHDKNGKEIYEGDLIKFKYKILFKIEWFNTAFWAIQQAGRGSSQPLSNLYSISDKNADYIAVIGNIHENP